MSAGEVAAWAGAAAVVVFVTVMVVLLVWLLIDVILDGLAARRETRRGLKDAKVTALREVER
ncbi:hypothetical protein [Nocardioides sp. InS609-2]|uniref:hypothetical protein n=1 Tax=Nocardioides sp. InS609-2 TaxID=2760705 RepID=UPI0020BFC33E|nr:hypothetical protein [Nocardioides sp. InS609-2]